MIRSNLYNLLILFVLFFSLPQMAFSQSEARKVISKSYGPGKLQSLSVRNTFGKVIIKDAVNGQATVEITIVVKGASDKEVHDILDKINIVETGAPDASFTTQMVVSNSGRQNTNMSIDYVLMLPKDIRLNINNSFGKIELGDYDGDLTLLQKFGDVKTGNLTSKSKITVEFGKLNSGNVFDGDLNCKFSSVQLGKLSGNFTSDFRGCESARFQLTDKINLVAIKNDYSTLEIVVPVKFAGDFTIDTKFGSFNNRSHINFTDSNTGYTRYQYRGTSGRGTTPVTINSNYGRITIVNE